LTQAEDPELADLRELVDLWLGDLKLDYPYTTASIIEAWAAAVVGFNSNPHKEFLLQVAADKNGSVSAKRLGEWLRRNTGRVVRVPDGRRFWLIRKQASANRAAFCLSEVK